MFGFGVVGLGERRDELELGDTMIESECSRLPVSGLVGDTYAVPYSREEERPEANPSLESRKGCPRQISRET